jgi:hypothetical protein
VALQDGGEAGDSAKVLDYFGFDFAPVSGFICPVVTIHNRTIILSQHDSQQIFQPFFMRQQEGHPSKSQTTTDQWSELQEILATGITMEELAQRAALKPDTLRKMKYQRVQPTVMQSLRNAHAIWRMLNESQAVEIEGSTKGDVELRSDVNDLITLRDASPEKYQVARTVWRALAPKREGKDKKS